MRLIRREDRERQGISFSKIESPFFAKAKVQEAFTGYSFRRIEGLDIRSYGRAWSQKEVLDAVERGDLLLVSSDPFSPLSDDSFGKYSHITGKGWAAGGFHKPVAQEKRPLPNAEPIVKPQPQEPGFYVVPKSTTAEQLESTLFATKNPAVISKFKSLNPNLTDVKAGSMIVLSDPTNLQCTREEALLMEAAAKTNEALKPLSASEADFMARHHAEIEEFLSQGSTAIGAGEAMFAKNLEAVKGTLRDIEALHESAFLKDGHLRSPEFFAERKRLLAQLNTGLTGLTRKGIGFPDHPNLKSALGISSRSLVHRWTKAGAPEQIPGYATHIEGVAKAAKVVKYGGWFGTAVGGGASYMKVQDVCSAGETEACKKIRFTETGSFAGGVAGGAFAGMVFTSPVVGTVCLALGVPTGGMATLACGIVLVGGASVAGGALGGSGGEMTGELLYEMTK
ncbi:hypothetical protein PS870_03731 [Pseudomonas fluorescens]|jgi:hypothetical protein|uniref:Uncharacterized protein n=1 Tax=Pseudomonas fluorescens TaxID=294 RepID=A0A5E7M512_PSEFL|nr:hypothetical protein [Pseudomonas fluorescens]VVP19188.1 hypothetical protein PS870_03731 [Pseudomonas fluorescens]